MGNNTSSSAKSSSTPQSPASTSHREKAHHHEPPPTRREPRRRESIQALSSGKATAAPPSANLATATAHPTSASTSQTRAIASSASPGHSGARSSTATTPRLAAQDTAEKAMGADASRIQRPSSRNNDNSQTLEKPAAPDAKISPASRPVDVPGSTERHSFDPSPLDPHAPGSEAFQLPPPNNFARPPRLPLPIEKEVHTPGSPIASPVASPSPIEVTDIDDGDDSSHRRSSNASNASSVVDEEEEQDEFSGYKDDTVSSTKTIPTVIEWRQGGDKVYVTGTFADFWKKKFRLHKNGPVKEPGVFSLIVPLPYGTHHLAFIVDGDSLTSRHLPTTVDFTNTLVNYIEVLPEDVPLDQPRAPTAAEVPPPSRPLDIRPRTVTSPEQPVSARPSPIPRPLGTSQPASPSPRTASQNQSAKATPPQQAKPAPQAKPAQPPKHYTSDIPPFMLDLDTWPPAAQPPHGSDNSPETRFHRATQACNGMPPPPSLPMFLGKSILNGITPMKDDTSVLIMPNHTVLNHLATTNIKAGVLATSATTRYKRKFLTTIMYKPRSDDGD